MTDLTLQLLAGILIGAIAGSFLSVVVGRVPQLIGLDDNTHFSWRGLVYGLSWPPSHCTQCQQHVRWYDNIPIASYVLLGGQCRSCHKHYGARYFAVEIISALIVTWGILNFGFTAEATFVIAFALGLLALSMIDISEGILPDVLIAPLFICGLVYQLTFASGLLPSLAGAGTAFAIMWLIRTSYLHWAGVDGLGYGDVKLAAMLGAWLGFASVPVLLFFAFAGGLAITLPIYLFGKLSAKTPLPFGPFLAAGAALILFEPQLVPFFYGLLGP
jgi:leader peptidase (prepilin peptidase)/N-methyltransferase